VEDRNAMRRRSNPALIFKVCSIDWIGHSQKED
jgi:hypothetical protein